MSSIHMFAIKFLFPRCVSESAGPAEFKVSMLKAVAHAIGAAAVCLKPQREIHLLREKVYMFHTI